jgi:hypothetical protein
VVLVGDLVLGEQQRQREQHPGGLND